jgi:hypothetical protein
MRDAASAHARDLLRLCGDYRGASVVTAKKPAGQDPENQRSELDTVPLCLRAEASPFWIILLLV